MYRNPRTTHLKWLDVHPYSMSLFDRVLQDWVALMIGEESLAYHCKEEKNDLQ